MQRAWRNIDVDRHMEQAIMETITPVNYFNGIMQCLKMENRTRLKTFNGQDTYGAIWYSVFGGTFWKSNIEINGGVQHDELLSLMKPS